MEYVRKKSLYDNLYKKNISFSLLHRIRMARHCLRGLVWLHGKDIAHRDIKSLNILVTEDYSCKLTDFGCAKLFKRDFNTPNVGSKLWMAPEVRTGIYEPKETDIWSMGIVIFEILNGTLPFWDAENEIAIIPDDTDYIGINIINRCMDIKSDNRPKAHEILESLDNWIKNILQCIYDTVEPDNRSTENDDDIIGLYHYLVNKNPYHVDKYLITIGELPEPKFKTSELYGSYFFEV